MGGQSPALSSLQLKRFYFEGKLTLSPVVKHRSKPALTQAWVNDAAYFDGTGFAQVSFAEESARMQRFEQEVKLLSHNGILLLLHNRVNIHPFILIHMVVLLVYRFLVCILLFSSCRASFCVWQCFRADSRSSMTSLVIWWNWTQKILQRKT